MEPEERDAAYLWDMLPLKGSDVKESPAPGIDWNLLDCRLREAS
jgi:hypothetical protein